MSEIEIINLLYSILTNGITTLADRYDSDKKTEFEKLKKQLKESNVLQKLIAGSLRSIKVNSREIDELKVLISDDVFSNKLADVISSPSHENDTIKLIVYRIKEGCNLSEDQALTLEPFIKKFATTLYGKVLNTPELSPYLIINGIETSSKISQREHSEIKESLKGLHKKIDEFPPKRFDKNDSTHVISDGKCESEQLIPATSEIQIPQDLSRVESLLTSELEDTLDKLNSLFKSKVNEIREIQKKRDFRKAIELYKSLLDNADKKIDKETMLGIYADCALCSVNIDDLKPVNNWLCKAEEIEPNDKRILAIRGLYYKEIGEKEKTKECVDKALAIDEFYHLALILKTSIELESGSNGNKILEKYFLDDKGNIKSGFKENHMAVIYRTIGQCHIKDNEFDKATEYFERSLTLDPSDDGTYALLGNAHLKKVYGKGSQIINFNEQLSIEKEELIRKAIEYFTKALELAARYNKIKDHISTNVNRSTCYMLLGDYDKAYDISGMSTTTEDLLKSKAAAAYYKGLFTETNKLLSKVKNATALDITNRVLALLNSANKKNALELIEESLNNESFSEDEIALIRYLRFEILLSEKDKENVEKELKNLEISTLPEWQKEKAIGDYYELIDDHNKADIHYKKALRHSDIAIPTKIFIADFYFVKEDYKTCFDICSSLSLGVIKSDLDICIRLLQMLVVSSFHILEIDKCKDYINYGKQQNIEVPYLQEISATIYWQEDELEKAREELSTILSKNATDDDLYLFTNFALVSLQLGDFKKAREYFLRAEKISGFYENSDTVINSIIALIVVNDKIQAKRIFKKALDLKFENKDDRIHKFAPAFYLRENNANLFAEYAIEFNKRHGDTAWLWKKDIEKDKGELKTIFSEAMHRSKEINKGYLKYPIPLVSLSSRFEKREVIHLWNFNREYGIPIFLESGNPKEVTDEISILSKNKSILIDYTALLTLQELGSEYLWVLDNAFDEIFVYRPMYLQMLNDLTAEEHDNLRQMLTYISNSNKVKFLKKEAVLELKVQNRALSNLISEEYGGLFQITHKQQMVLLMGEVRLRGIAISIGLTACGVRSFLEYCKCRNIIDVDILNEGIVKLIKKDAQFISFNKNTLIYISMRYSIEEFKNIFNKLSDHIFLSKSEIDSFTNVYCGFIKKYLNSIYDNQIIKYLIEKTIIDVKKLTSRALSFNIAPYLNSDDALTDMNKINQFCLGYIYRLLVLIYTTNIDEQLRLEYVEVIKNEANLVYWYRLTLMNKSVIKFVFDEAEKKSQELNLKKKNKIKQ